MAHLKPTRPSLHRTPEPAAPQHPGGYVAIQAVSDLTSDAPEVVIERCLPHDVALTPESDLEIDPMVSVRITIPAIFVRAADAEHEGDEHINIDQLPSALLNPLIQALTQAAAVARHHGVLPRALDEVEYRQYVGNLWAKREAVAREAAAPQETAPAPVKRPRKRQRGWK